MKASTMRSICSEVAPATTDPSLRSGLRPRRGRGLSFPGFAGKQACTGLKQKSPPGEGWAEPFRLALRARSGKKKKARHKGGLFDFKPGDDLLSHPANGAVTSALRGLTTVFGMGTGVTPAVWSPGRAGGWSLEAGG